MTRTKTSTSVLLFAAIVVWPAAANPQLPPSTAELVGKLADLPDWLEPFEAIVGALHRDLTVWEEAVGPVRRDFASGPIEHVDVAFSIDMYHQDPQREKNVRLSSWEVRFRGEQEAALAQLRQRFGDGEPLDFAVGHPRRFGHLFLTPLPRGAFQLAWYATEPEWAVPPRSAEEERALEDHLIAFLRAGIRDETLHKFFPGLAKRPGWDTLESRGPQWRAEISPHEGGQPAWISIEIRGLPLDATRLVRSLGLREPGFVASDVHLSHDELSDLATGKQPTIDGYELNLRVDHQLLTSTPAKRPGQAAWTVKDWRIRSLWLRRLSG